MPESHLCYIYFMADSEDDAGIWLLPCPNCGRFQYYSWEYRGLFFICPGCHGYLDLIPVWLDKVAGIAFGLKLVSTSVPDRHE
jgi:hypothetical protein